MTDCEQRWMRDVAIMGMTAGVASSVDGGAEHRHQVLVVDFDMFSVIGGGQTFYRKLIERNRWADFTYLSRGPDLARQRQGDLPPNAHPVALRQDLQTAPFERIRQMKGLPRHYQEHALKVAASVAGRHFDTVEVPSYIPLGGVLRAAMRLFGVSAERVVLALLGWQSVGIANGYDRAALATVTAAITTMENDGLAAADAVYTISDLHRAENTGRTEHPISVIDMHDALDPPSVKPITALADAPELWFVGRLDGNKGPDVFVEILARLPPGSYASAHVSGPDGGGPVTPTWSQTLLERARQLGVAVHYHGALDDDELRRRAFRPDNVVVIPSRADSFNYVAVEALTSGTPVLLSRAAGAAAFIGQHHPDVPLMTMAAGDAADGARVLASFLAGYPASARAFHQAVATCGWPAPRSDFLREVYLAPLPESPAAAWLPSPYIAPLPWSPLRVKRPVPGSEAAQLTVIVSPCTRPEALLTTLNALADAVPPPTRVIVTCEDSPAGVHFIALAAAYTPWLARIDQAPGGDVADAINRGLAAVDTPFAMVLNEGETLTPQWPARALDALREPSVTAVLPTSATAADMVRMIEAHRCEPGAVFRVPSARASGGWRSGFTHLGGYDLLLRLSLEGRLVHAPGSAVYRSAIAEVSAADAAAVVAAAHIRVIADHLAMRANQGQPAPWRLRHRALAVAHLAAAHVLVRAGDSGPAARRYILRALRLDPTAVLRPPAHLADCRGAYPRWLERLLAISDPGYQRWIDSNPCRSHNHA